MVAQDPVARPYQHYIWQQYLSAWADGKYVQCLVGDRIFQTTTQNLGVEYDFYKLPEVTDEDLWLITFLTGLDKAHPVARHHHEGLLVDVLGPLIFAKECPDALDNPEVAKLIEVHRTNAIDDRHTALERSFLPLLPKCLEGDISWFQDTANAIAFCSYVGAQHMHTRAVKAKNIKRLKDRMNLDISRVWDLMALIFGFNYGCSIFFDRANRPLVLVHNETLTPFITSDQPVVNLEGDGENAPDSLSIYYPISPRLALFIGEPGKPQLPKHGLTDEQAATLNLRIERRSHLQVYAQTADALEVFRASRRAGQ